MDIKSMIGVVILLRMRSQVTALVIGLFIFGSFGIANASLYQVSCIQDNCGPYGFEVAGYIEFSDNYTLTGYRNGAVLGPDLYPVVQMDMISWNLEYTIYDEAKLASGYLSSYSMSGNSGYINFGNDVNDLDRPDDGFLMARELNLGTTDILIFGNDLDRCWSSPCYNEGITGMLPNYTLSDTLRFSFGTTTFFDDRVVGNYGVLLTAVPIPSAIWLFSSGFIGLIGFARRKNAQQYTC